MSPSSAAYVQPQRPTYQPVPLRLPEARASGTACVKGPEGEWAWARGDVPFSPIKPPECRQDPAQLNTMRFLTRRRGWARPKRATAAPPRVSWQRLRVTEACASHGSSRSGAGPGPPPRCSQMNSPAKQRCLGEAASPTRPGGADPGGGGRLPCQLVRTLTAERAPGSQTRPEERVWNRMGGRSRASEINRNES